MSRVTLTGVIRALSIRNDLIDSVVGIAPGASTGSGNALGRSRIPAAKGETALDTFVLAVVDTLVVDDGSALDNGAEEAEASTPCFSFFDDPLEAEVDDPAQLAVIAMMQRTEAKRKRGVDTTCTDYLTASDPTKGNYADHSSEARNEEQEWRTARVGVDRRVAGVDPSRSGTKPCDFFGEDAECLAFE